MTFKIVTDSTADLPQEYIEKENLTVLGMTITINGKAFETVGEKAITTPELLKKMAKGAEVSSSAIGSGELEEIFKKLSADGSEVLYLAFSSGLSGTYQSAVIARDMVLEEKPEAKITIIDTLAAASGEGYLVEEAVRLRNSGAPLQETVEILSALTKRLRSWFVVPDLNHLARGGRIPKATALLGTLASVKPILDVDAEGQLRQVSKVRGNKKANAAIVTETLSDFDDDYPHIIIAHSDAEETAQQMKEEFLSAKPQLTVDIRPLGPVIAVHTGAGTIAIFSMGTKDRH